MQVAWTLQTVGLAALPTSVHIAQGRVVNRPSLPRHSYHSCLSASYQSEVICCLYHSSLSIISNPQQYTAPGKQSEICPTHKASLGKS